MLSIIITGQDELEIGGQDIERLHQRLSGDLTPLMQDIGTLLQRSTRERFLSKQDPDGNHWQNLLPSTQAKKGDNNILVQLGLLGKIGYNAYADRVEVGSTQDYGVYHQFGTSAMVARPFLGLSDEDEQGIYATINDYLQGE